MWSKKEVKKKIDHFKTFVESVERPDLMGFQFKCENLWKKPDCQKRAKLHYKMHPMIFMKENLPAYEKIQNNWLY
jgi:hypothetical protein